jgi:arylsulfate sulfotransferase
LDRSRASALPVVLSLFAALCAAGCGVTQGTLPPTTPSSPTQPVPVATSSGSVSISPQYVALGPGQKVQFSASSTVAGPIAWLVNGAQGGNASVGTIDASGDYTAPGSLQLSENVTITAELASAPQQDYATAVASIINYGVVYPTANPQVDLYDIYVPAPGRVSVQFGETTSYGFNTWQVPAPSSTGGQVTVEVAGMLPQTLYHMRAQVVLSDGATFTDTDHDQFASGLPLKTGSPPTTSAITITGSGSPQPGIELWNTVLPPGDTQAFATDLQGNVLWTYSYTGSALDIVQGVQLLPDGDMLMLISYLSSLPPQVVDRTPGTIDVVREVDLAGNTIRQIGIGTLNQELAVAGFHDSDGTAYQLRSLHHDVLALPNGHWVLLASYPKTFTNLPGYPGTTTVLGDVLVDVDQNLQPDWVWNSFDHLDVNRHPMNFPDWTHGNDLLYSADDHNLLLSMRHQNWIIKIDFDDGQGSGNILWRLGYQGDFQLLDSSGDPDNDPADWFYAQHGISYFSPNTTGVFRLGVMDNGNDRIFPPPNGQVFCKNSGPYPPQCYSTFPVLQVDEDNMTASFVFHDVPPPSDFSFFGGSTQWLANGDSHVDFCAPLSGALVQEFDPSGSQLIWQATTPGADQFRVERLGSLYPGVQW